MASGKGVASVVIAATVVMVLFNPVAALVDSTTGTTSVANEEVTVANDSFFQLDGYNIQEDSETVQYKNATGTWVNATEGTDYEMKYSEGSIKALPDGSIEDGETVRVWYDYEPTDGATTTVLTMVPLFMALLVLGTFGEKIGAF
jgi:hypothetical protein